MTYAEYYKDMLEIGRQFEDFVSLRFYQWGVPVVSMRSRLKQTELGENIAGVEIKFAPRFRDFGALWIEFYEKSDPDHAEYVPSGVLRPDNSWLFVIGDEQDFWVFAKRHLQRLEARGLMENTTGTSRGYKLSVTEADKICCRKFEGGEA